MNKDFHYYGTYVAARLANYTFGDSVLLAHAAQYVDDSSNDTLKNGSGEFYIKAFTPVPTVHTLSELAMGDLNWTESFLNEVARVWPVFHFLPGNYTAGGSYIRPYNGKLRDEQSLGIAKWQYDDEAKEQFKLMCLPDSLLVECMINDLRGSSSLHAIGLRMHTLADTRAHMYYAGIPAWFINHTSVSHQTVNGHVAMPEIMSLSPQQASAATAGIATPFYNSYLYLGHAKAGHTPDYPYEKYTINPQWAGAAIDKDNQADFLVALRQLIEALRCIKQDTLFSATTYATIDPENEGIIRKVLATAGEDQSQAWKNNIPSMLVGGQRLEVPEDYDPNKWLNEMKCSPEITGTDYYKFNLAAKSHLAFIKARLALNNIFLDDIPDERTFVFRIRDANAPGLHIAKNKDAYPTLGEPHVALCMIMPDSKCGTLLNGVVVKIKTTEQDVQEKGYLGAWPTPSLYYYTKDWNLFKQKWAIRQEGLAEGDLIDLSRPVYIMNMHYDGQPYLCPNSEYLTTSSAKHSWYLEQ